MSLDINLHYKFGVSKKSFLFPTIIKKKKINMNAKELKEKLDKHLKWLNNEEGGKCADLSYADLRGADLRFADLRFADLSYANLYNANLSSADLSDAELRGANISDAILCYANLRFANLREANLSGVDLRNASLRDANLRDANLSGAKNIPFILSHLPDGEFIAWKKVKNYIIKLKILEDSKRSRATTDKCRCDKALVLEIQNFDSTKADITEIVNDLYVATTYKIGDVVYADSWDENRWNECSHGIHFFIDRESAVMY